MLALLLSLYLVTSQGLATMLESLSLPLVDEGLCVSDGAPCVRSRGDRGTALLDA